MSKKEDCIIQSCDNLAHTRGLCPKHYQKYVYRVRTGKTTWEELENLGLIRPAKGEVIDDKPKDWWSNARKVANELDLNHEKGVMTSIGKHIIVINPNVLKSKSSKNIFGGKVSKKDVLLRVKEVLKANDLDDLVILIFNSKSR